MLQVSKKTLNIRGRLLDLSTPAVMGIMNITPDSFYAGSRHQNTGAALQQAGKMPLINGWKIYHHPSTDSLTLQWYSDFHLKWYPWQKLGSLFYENTYGVMMEEGLGNLKRLAEK